MPRVPLATCGCANDLDEKRPLLSSLPSVALSHMAAGPTPFSILWDKYKHTPPRTRLLFGSLMMSVSLVGLFIADQIEAAIPAVPNPTTNSHEGKHQ